MLITTKLFLFEKELREYLRGSRHFNSRLYDILITLYKDREDKKNNNKQQQKKCFTKEHFTCVHTWFIFNAFSLLDDFFAKIIHHKMGSSVHFKQLTF